MRITLTLAAFAGITMPCLAQGGDFIGFSYNAMTGATSRGTVGVAAGEVMNRIDGNEHAGWGLGGAPNTRTITSIALVVQDQNAATAETFDIVIYPEDPTNPNFPDLASGVAFATGLAGPTGTGIVAQALTITPSVPVSVPIQGGGDVFVSFVVTAQPLWATDGISFHAVLGYQPNANFLTFDIPGLAQGGTPPPVAAPSNSHGLRRIGTGAAAYDLRRNYNIDIAHRDSGGTALAITNQTSYIASNNPPPVGWGPAPGTADFMSGSNPDVVGGNPGRADDINMEFFRTGIGTGAPVFFLMDFATSFGPELPLSGFVPGSSGVVCLNVSSAAVLGMVLTTADEAWLVTPVPAAVRPNVSGFNVRQQAIAFDLPLNVLHASPCDAMIL